MAKKTTTTKGGKKTSAPKTTKNATSTTTTRRYLGKDMAGRDHWAESDGPPKKPRQQALPGTRKADKELDRAAEQLDDNRCARLQAQAKEKEAEDKLIALMQGKGLTEYLLADGDRVVIGPKSTKIGAKIVAPKEDDEDEARANRKQTKLSVVTDGLGGVEEVPF